MADFDPYLSWLGIPPTQRPPTHYQLLGVDAAISDPQIIKALAIQRIAYVRNFQKGEHADVCARMLEELANAEAVLTDVVRRAAYDKTLKPVAQPAPPAAPRPASPPVIPASAVRIEEPPPVKRHKRSRRKEKALAIKWLGGAAVAVVGVVLLVALTKLMGGPEQGSLDLVFDEMWPDAVVSIDGQRVAAHAAGANLKLPVGEHAVEVARGNLGRFTANVTLQAREPTRLPVPSTSFAKPAPPAKVVVARYKSNPPDAAVTVAKGSAKVDRQGAEFVVTMEAAAFAAGVELSFAKSGYKTQAAAVTKRDVESQSPVEVVMESAVRRTAQIAVTPADADVFMQYGQTTRGAEKGTFELAVAGEAAQARVTVSAPGYTQKTFDVALDGSLTRVALGASWRDVWDYYWRLNPDSALRLLGRAGGFGASARKIALSKNGKFLAVAEGCRPCRVHVWDVASAQFVGNVCSSGRGKPGEKGPPYAPPLSVAVSNDGKLVAVTCFVIYVFDVASGREVRKFGKDETSTLGGFLRDEVEIPRVAGTDPSSREANDVLSLAFSSDDGLLYASLRGGRVMARDTESWRITETLSGFETAPEDLRIADDASYALVNTKNGPRLWAKESGACAPLDKTGVPIPASRWSARPQDEHFYVAPPMNAPGPKGYSLEVRTFDAPESVSKTIYETHPIQWVQALGGRHVAVAVHRRPGGPINPEDELATVGDWGLHIWDAKTGTQVAAAYVPSVLYDFAASDDGAVLATVVGQEHSVAVWKFNPKGKRIDRYSPPPTWEGYAGLRWSGRMFTHGLKSIEEIVNNPPKPATLRERGGGKWTLHESGRDNELRELRRTRWAVVLEGGGTEYHAFNNGKIWTLKAGGSSRSYVPNYEGERRSGSRRDRLWDDTFEGTWFSDLTTRARD